MQAHSCNKTVKVPILDYVEAKLPDAKERMALRKRLGAGATAAERKAAYGGVNADLFDNDISPADQKAVAAKAERDPWGLIAQVAKEGANELGGGVVSRDFEFLMGMLKFEAKVALGGTATVKSWVPWVNFDDKKVKGDGAHLRAQASIELPVDDIISAASAYQLQVGKYKVESDRDANGNPLHPRMRFNMDCKIVEDGFRDVSLSAILENLPSASLPALLEEFGNETIDIPMGMIFRVLADLQSKAGITIFNGETQAGVQSTLSRIDPSEFAKDLPDVAIAASADARLAGDGMIDLGGVKLATVSKLNFLKGDDGNVKVQYQNQDGKYVDFELSEPIEASVLVDWLTELLS